MLRDSRSHAHFPVMNPYFYPDPDLGWRVRSAAQSDVAEAIALLLAAARFGVAGVN